MKLLPGRYKGTRKRHEAPALIIIECPGCGWRSQGAKPEYAEVEYVLHLNNVHHGTLECAFCDPSVAGRGLRFLPDFGTLAQHVKHFHPKRFAGCEEGAIPPGAFR